MAAAQIAAGIAIVAGPSLSLGLKNNLGAAVFANQNRKNGKAAADIILNQIGDGVLGGSNMKFAKQRGGAYQL